MSDLSLIAAHVKKHNDAAAARKVVKLDGYDGPWREKYIAGCALRVDFDCIPACCLPTRTNRRPLQSFVSGTLDKTVDPTSSSRLRQRRRTPGAC
ncbi:hypothetical protein [Caballeronia sp. M1242]|uniref:hypothetical protein n=1 Tax=Caballeronia sp. M1242 TaxID=2814653 RepID=UPI0019D215C4|nr:hypothetical protein [Caballeronia sp. M1242]QSN64361.1 hypothetical protein JYK05_19990 [Caballeronia sp. M1242]